MRKISSTIRKAATAIHRSWRRLQVFVERGTPTKPVSPEETTCSHCGRVFVGNYCPRCGQHRDAGKGKPHFLKTFREAYPQLSGNFIRTIIHLGLRPGYMIRDYFRGHRVLYQSPVSTFLIAVSVTALCEGIFGHIIHDDANKEKVTIVDQLSKTLSDEVKEEADKDIQVRKAQDRWKSSRSLEGHRRIAATLGALKKHLTSDLSFTLFAFLPLVGSVSYLVFRKRMFDGRRLTLMEHYVIFVYLSAFFCFFDFLNFLNFYRMLYIAWAYRAIYRLSWLNAMAYALAVVFLTVIGLVFFVLLLMGVMVTPLLYYYNVPAA